jgi:hypothetical protein
VPNAPDAAWVELLSGARKVSDCALAFGANRKPTQQLNLVQVVE